MSDSAMKSLADEVAHRLTVLFTDLDARYPTPGQRDAITRAVVDMLFDRLQARHEKLSSMRPNSAWWS